jgi:hypothetical protein
MDRSAEQLAILVAACAGAALAATPLAVATLRARSAGAARLAGGARVVGRVAFVVAAWALSFTAVAQQVRFEGRIPGLVLAVAGPALLVAVAAVVVGLRRDDVEPLARGEAMLLAATVVAFAAGLSLESGRAAALVANLALGFLAAGRIARGLFASRRAAFREGLAIAALLLATRCLEAELSAPARTVAFVAAAIALVAGLVWFERRRAHLTAG